MAGMTTYTCAVSFEFDTQPPMTWRGPIQASSESTAGRLALVAARKSLRPMAPSSVVLLLERASKAQPAA
jgi:hypothetical protein